MEAEIDGADMKWSFYIALFPLVAIELSYGAENPLSIKIIKTERSGESTYLLFSVENTLIRDFRTATGAASFSIRKTLSMRKAASLKMFLHMVALSSE